MRPSIPLATVAAAIVFALSSGCTLNADGEGLWTNTGEDGGYDAYPADVSHDPIAEDTAPDVPAQPDVPCFPPDKLCNASCARFDDPQYGCVAATCSACAPYDHAGSVCSNGGCALGPCTTGWGNCDSLPANACETPLTTLDNCAACGTTCSLEHATATCSTGDCAVAACDPGFADCDGKAVNGCETNLHTLEHCGSCTAQCQVANGDPTCATGTCLVNACTDPLTADCDGDAANGCETDLRTLSNCGGCGQACTQSHATATCDTGACQIASCDAGFGDCDFAANGCETNLQTSTSHCGACGGACSTQNASSSTCTNGQCVPTCATNFDDCNGPQEGNADDGCEVNLQTDPVHCGACKDACSSSHLPTPSCAAGVCNGACAAGFSDCNGNKLTDGCEVDTVNSPDSCGGCGMVCSGDHVPSRTCAGGMCNGACESGFADCNGSKLADGCEINLLADPEHCGACPNVCSSANIPSRVCSAGLCTGNCAAGYSDCNSDKLADGCESNLQTDPDHCGSCTSACSNTNMQTRTCLAGTCNGTCKTGFVDCNNDKLSNGCEINVTTDKNNCGTCTNVCSTTNGTANCAASTCGINCAAGFANCDSNVANGCEINTTTDPLHCGTCAGVCSTTNVPTRTCAAGVCNGACASGFADCNANKLADGCEINTVTDKNHCGTCPTACNATGGTATCAASICGITCTTGFADCDNNAANGCEVNLLTSADHCGTCASVCSGANIPTRTCAAGVCNGACATGFGDCNANKLADGCETTTSSDLANCGTCGHACSGTSGTASCNGGVCGIACAAGFADCDSNAANGCEVTTTTDPLHCGSCSGLCSTANIPTRTCTASLCSGACAAGYTDCNNSKLADGCEVNTAADTNHCGTCTTVCSTAGGTASCTTGACGITCTTGFANCDTLLTNGCEITTTNDPLHCGACAGICSTTNIPTRTCAASVCNGTCASGFADCNNNKITDGCETTTSSDIANCGLCGHVCNATNGTASCTTGVCDITCAVGFADCDNDASNGCEVNLNASPDHCGTCNTVCSAANIPTRTCTAGVCSGACALGFADCNSNKLTDGCEINTTTDPTHCSTCATICVGANGTATCTSSVCGIVCAPDYGNCDGNLATGCETNLLIDVNNCGGCSRPCSTTHVTGNTNGLSCNARVCDTTACVTGWSNVNFPPGTLGDDGCETATP